MDGRRKAKWPKLSRLAIGLGGRTETDAAHPRSAKRQSSIHVREKAQADVCVRWMLRVSTARMTIITCQFGRGEIYVTGLEKKRS